MTRTLLILVEVDKIRVREDSMKPNDNEKSSVELNKKERIKKASKYINRQYDKSLRMLSQQGEGASSKDFK